MQGWLSSFSDRARGVVGARHRVVEERRRDELAARVVHARLAERLTRALRHGAVQLALDDHRVDDRADVVHRPVADDAATPVSGSISTSQTCAPLRTRSWTGRRSALLQPGLHARRQVVGGVRGPRHVRERDPAVGALHHEAPLARTRRRPSAASSRCAAMRRPFSMIFVAASRAPTRRPRASASRTCRCRTAPPPCRLRRCGSSRAARRGARRAPARTWLRDPARGCACRATPAPRRSSRRASPRIRRTRRVRRAPRRASTVRRRTIRRSTRCRRRAGRRVRPTAARRSSNPS